MSIKHSKYKNTGILFELLVRQITADTLDGKDSPARKILKNYFVKTELGREYKLYETLFKKTNLTEGKANLIIDTLLESSKNLNKGVLRRQKYNLINEIKNHYDVTKFFKHKLPHYRVQASFYSLVESISSNKNINPKFTINNKLTILEHLISNPVSPKQKETVITEYSKYDKDLRTLTYKVLLEKFNGKYDNLNNGQKEILRELINSIDNTPRLKEFYNSKVNEIQSELSTLNKKVKDETTKIKVNEVKNIICELDKSSKVKDDDLINLLQYYDLIDELKVANV
jgi:hypothetical protein|tara:strand:+ start:778 stop:1632 length:855 start_codon:yes stop_codon:yes gene_type:complete